MSQFSHRQVQFMREALRFAGRGGNRVSPNPMVGAVVVRSGRVVGRGHHAFFGGPHAEVIALRQAGPRARRGDLYVTLEPCAHQGKTPPCTEAILRAGIRRVFYGVGDPNPLTEGRGPRFLRKSGIQVFRGLLAKEARELNRSYFHWRSTGRPWVILKWAMTLDGKIATRKRESRWITGKTSRALVQELRRRVDGVMVGTETLRQDNSLLLPRPERGRVPARIILDRRGRLPLSLNILKPEATRRSLSGKKTGRSGKGRRIYAVSIQASAQRRQEVRARGLEVLVVRATGGRLSLPSLLDALGASGISQLLVEGGGELIGSFLDAGLAQEAYVFMAPVIFGGREAPGPAGGRGIGPIADALRLESPEVQRLGADVLIHGRIR